MAMVTAKAEVTLPLSEFQPQSTLVTAEHHVERARFPVIDYHNHLDALDPVEVLRIMDACGIERIVNITMKTGDEAIRMIDKFRSVDAERFATIGWMDWSGVEKDDFVELTLRPAGTPGGARSQGNQVLEKPWTERARSQRETCCEWTMNGLRPSSIRRRSWGSRSCSTSLIPTHFSCPSMAATSAIEELAAHPDWSFHGSQFSKKELLDQRDRVIARHPKTTFVAAHVAECGENLARATQLLENHPNVLLDISARASELGRQPYSSRALFLRFPDRILFGSDLVPEESMYRLYFRFLETADEYFDYPSHASRQGRWQIHGLYLPDEILRKVYRENALRLLS